MRQEATTTSCDPLNHERQVSPIRDPACSLREQPGALGINEAG